MGQRGGPPDDRGRPGGGRLGAHRVVMGALGSPRLLLTHAGVTTDDVALADLPREAASDAEAAAAALNGALDRSVASWREGTPLVIPGLHRPGNAAQGEGRGIFSQRPARPEHAASDAALFVGPPRRRFDPRGLPPGLVQAVGHIGDRKCRELLGQSWAPPAAKATLGRLRHLRANRADVAYDVGISEAWDLSDAVMLFLDGTMAKADPHAYEFGVSTAVCGDDVQVGMPLQEISRGGDRDDDPTTCVGLAARVAQELLDRLGPGAGKLAEQLPPATEQWTQQARDREHHVAVRDGQEHVLAQPLGPQELLLLLARGAEAAAPTREGDEHAPAALRAPKPCEAVLQQAAFRNSRNTRSTTGRSVPCCRRKRTGHTRSNSSRCCSTRR